VRKGLFPIIGDGGWLARLVAGDATVVMGTESRGASNARAKRELSWTLRYPSWRQGFVAAYGSTAAAARRPRLVSARRRPDTVLTAEAARREDANDGR
jgi:hypothetical protein